MFIVPVVETDNICPLNFDVLLKNSKIIFNPNKLLL